MGRVDVVLYTCQSSTAKVEAEGSGVQIYPREHINSKLKANLGYMKAVSKMNVHASSGC